MRCKSYFKTISALAVAAVFLASPAALAAKPKKTVKAQTVAGAPENLTLAKALARAIASNRTILQARLNLRAAQLTYDNAWDAMFMPSINLNAVSNSNFTIGHVSQVPADAATTLDSHGYPTTAAGISLGSYTIFNFWKDWNVYEQARLDWVRNKEIFAETVRSTRFQVISAFFRYKTEQDKLDASQRSLDIAEAILELVKSRARLSKATERDISSSDVDLLNAKNDYLAQLTTMKQALWNLNLVLGDPVDTPYTIDEAIRYVLLQLSVPEAMRLYSENSPTMKTARRDIKKAELALELEQKNRIPLPRIGFSGVTVNYNNSYANSGTTVSTAPQLPPPFPPLPPSSNFDVTAQILFSVPLTGPGGLFNGRKVEQAEINRDLAELQFQDNGNKDQASIYQLILTIKQSEQGIENNRENFERSSKLLDGLFSQLSTTQVNRLELRDAIKQARTSELALSDSIVAHLSNKLTLAQTIGIDRLPGDPYQ